MKQINELLWKTLLRIFAVTLLTGWLTLSVPAPLLASELKIYKDYDRNFTLMGHHGSKVSLKDYRGKVVLIFFGYTFCPDVCPTTLADLKQVMKKLGKQADQVQTLFILVDPERDTPERLKEYVTYFYPSFMGLTGTIEELTSVTKQYKTMFMKQKVESASGAFFAHSSSVYLIDKEGRMRGRFKTKWDSEKLIFGIQQLINPNHNSMFQKIKNLFKEES